MAFENVWNAVKRLIPLPKGHQVGNGEIVEIVTMTTYPETAWKVIGPVTRGQYVWCPEASDHSFPAGNYPCVAIGAPSNGYNGNLRWAVPQMQGRKPWMSGIDPQSFQRD